MKKRRRTRRPSSGSVGDFAQYPGDRTIKFDDYTMNVLCRVVMSC